MTLIDIVRIVWLSAGFVAVYYTIRKLRIARADHRAHKEEKGNGTVLHAGRWRIHAAIQSLAIAVAILTAASLSILDWLIPGPAVLSLWIVIVFTIMPIIFVWKQIDDDRNHQKLLDLVTTRKGSRQRRKMDDHGEPVRSGKE